MSIPATTVTLQVRDDPRLAHSLRARLEARKLELAEPIVQGFPKDYPDYRERVGMIKGLTEAIAECAATERELNGD